MNSTEWRANVTVEESPRGCWIWNGPPNTDGYAVRWFTDLKGQAAIARLALAEKLGRPIGPGLLACHTCDNRMCVNPEHVYEGTHGDNMRDKTLRGRVRNSYTKYRLGKPLADGTIEALGQSA